MINKTMYNKHNMLSIKYNMFIRSWLLPEKAGTVQNRCFSATKMRYSATSLTVYTTAVSIPSLWLISLQFALPIMLFSVHLVD